MSKKKNENINDDIHSDSETELEELNEVSEEERISELEDTVPVSYTHLTLPTIITV